MEVEPKGWHSRGYLPHFDVPDVVQAITFRLADSLPKEVLGAWPSRPPSREARAEHSRKVEAVLDAGHGACALRDPRAAGIVEEALLHFDGVRYRLLAWAVMPNHVHVLIRSQKGHPVSAIVHSWKSFTANRVRAIIPGEGRFWQPDYFDRYIRHERHFAAVAAYIEANPVKAGLCAMPEDWPFGSARRR